jgi:hypothetical protein
VQQHAATSGVSGTLHSPLGVGSGYAPGPGTSRRGETRTGNPWSVPASYASEEGNYTKGEDDDYNDDDTEEEKLSRSASTGKRHSGQHTNVHTVCGRHGDEWLFNGFSVTEAVKKMWEPHPHREREDRDEAKRQSYGYNYGQGYEYASEDEKGGEGEKRKKKEKKGH